MCGTRLSRFGLCLVIVSLCVPLAFSAQEFPPSVTLDINTGEEGQIGATVQTADPGPNVANLTAFFTGEIVNPAAVAESSEIAIEPMFDEQEFPNGPSRTRLTFSPVTLPVGQSFTPGFVGFIVPDRIGSTLTPESFLETLLLDYTLEVNGIKFMDSDLFTPEHVTRLGPFDGGLLGFTGEMVWIWGLNVTMKASEPGTFVIRDIIRFPKTVPMPEVGATNLGGELIVEVTVNIAPAGSAIWMPAATDGWKVVGESMMRVSQALEARASH